ncbi:hypothetical protein FQN57_002590 [Myotisia sp. PD_48]|nr:hypothetical protein FQN57_002590 [Myotisia sp. PD_48]
MSEGRSEGFVERRDIPDLSLYRMALDEHESVARDLTRPKIADNIVLTLFKSGWTLLSKSEISYQESTTEDRSKYRPPKANKCRFNVTVYFPGMHSVGAPYMTLIPFYVIGDVNIEGTQIQIDSCYDVFGSCNLEISADGKLGAFLMRDVQFE